MKRSVGITQECSARAATHLRTKGIEIEQIGRLGNLPRDDARAVEQALIEFYGLGKDDGTLLNRISSIRPSDPGYAALLARGHELLQKQAIPASDGRGKLMWPFGKKFPSRRELVVQDSWQVVNAEYKGNTLIARFNAGLIIRTSRATLSIGIKSASLCH